MTISDLAQKMDEFLIGAKETAYDKCWIKSKLVDLYGDDILFSASTGQKTIITYRKSINKIISNYYNTPKDIDLQQQKVQLIKTAAELIQSEIKEMPDTFKETFPTTDDLQIDKLLAYLPETLQIFLKTIFVGSQTNKQKMKMSAIGHAITQACRPRSISAPMQIALAVTLHHHYQSRYIIDVLHGLGLSSSYNEVLQFERSAAKESFVDLAGCLLEENSLLKASGDNVDHQTCTLDGRNTFHGMGMIAIVSNGTFVLPTLHRRKVTDKEILAKSRVPIVNYYEKSELLKNIKFKPIDEKLTVGNLHEYYMWVLTFYFKNPAPIWSGFMQLLFERSNKKEYSKDEIMNLPMIDLDPTDMSCILSTITFFANLARKNNQDAIITFD